jgi:hypothetical protein
VTGDRRDVDDSQLPDRLLASAGTGGRSPDEARAARLLAKMSPARELSPQAVARIQSRIAGSWLEPRRSLFARPVLVFGTLGLVAFLTAGAFAGRQLVSGFVRGPEIVALPHAPAAAAPTPVRHRAPAAAVEAPAVAPPAAEPPPPARRRARAPEKGGLAEESRVISAALELLHREHDARGALARLDEHDARFPGGELRREATMARIEALLMAGRSREALRLLDGSQPGRTPRDAEVLVLRGELRADAGRCAEAERDFSGALARTARGASAERALFGRASCRSRRGDTESARADLNAYLAAFPAGRFAAKARAALASAPSAAE